MVQLGGGGHDLWVNVQRLLPLTRWTVAVPLLGAILAFGSAMASIGLTIPTIAVASIWLPGRLVLGLNATQIVLLVLTVAVGALAAPLGRAGLLQSGVRLVIFAAFLFLAVRP